MKTSLRIFLSIVMMTTVHGAPGCNNIAFDVCPPSQECTNQAFYEANVNGMDIMRCLGGSEMQIRTDGEWSKWTSTLVCQHNSNTCGSGNPEQWRTVDAVACVQTPKGRCTATRATGCPPDVERCDVYLLVNAGYIACADSEDDKDGILYRKLADNRWIQQKNGIICDGEKWRDGLTQMPVSQGGNIQVTCAILPPVTTTTTTEPTTTTTQDTSTTPVPPLSGSCSQDCPDVPTTGSGVRYDYDPVTGCKRLYCRGQGIKSISGANNIHGMYTCDQGNKWTFNINKKSPWNSVTLASTDSQSCADPTNPLYYGGLGIYTGCGTLPAAPDCPQSQNCTNEGPVEETDPNTQRQYLTCRDKQLWIKNGNEWLTDYTVQCFDAPTSTFQTETTKQLLSAKAQARCVKLQADWACNKCQWIDTGSTKRVTDACEEGTTDVRLRCPPGFRLMALTAADPNAYVEIPYLYCRSQNNKWYTNGDRTAESPHGPYIAMIRCIRESDSTGM